MTVGVHSSCPVPLCARQNKAVFLTVAAAKASQQRLHGNDRAEFAVATLQRPPVQHSDAFAAPALRTDDIPLRQIGQGRRVVPLRHKNACRFRRYIVVIAAGQIDAATMAHIIPARCSASIHVYTPDPWPRRRWIVDFAGGGFRPAAFPRRQQHRPHDTE